MLIHVYIYMYISELFIYSLQIFGYDSLWYNCSIVIIIYPPPLVFPCFILLFVLVICAFFHTCMFLMQLSLLIKNLNLFLLKCLDGKTILGLSNRCFEVILKILREKRCFRGSQNFNFHILTN